MKPRPYWSLFRNNFTSSKNKTKQNHKKRKKSNDFCQTKRFCRSLLAGKISRVSDKHWTVVLYGQNLQLRSLLFCKMLRPIPLMVSIYIPEMLLHSGDNYEQNYNCHYKYTIIALIFKFNFTLTSEIFTIFNYVFSFTFNTYRNKHV